MKSQVISIPQVDKTDKALLIIVILGIIFTSFAWIGDIASWIYLGNGFTIDVILLVVAIAFTGFTVLMRSKMKKEESSEEINEELKELQELEEDEAKIADETNYKKIISCSNCGTLIALSDKNCPSCGSPKPVCVVCLTAFKEKEEIVKLTCCSSYAHKEHIDNWVSVKGHCPKCHKEIQDNQQNILLL